MERVIALIERPADVAREDWNESLLKKIAPGVAEKADAAFAALYLIDALASELSLGEATGAASFEAAFEIAPVTGDPSDLLPALRAFGTLHAYAVEQRRVKAYPRDWAQGERSPGVFMISPVYRSAAIDAAAFDAHWRDRHAPLALCHHVGMWEYRQNVVRRVLTPGSPPYDGIAQLGFATLDDFRERLYDSPEGARTIGDDIPRFLDLRHSEAAMMGEVVLKSRD